MGLLGMWSRSSSTFHENSWCLMDCKGVCYLVGYLGRERNNKVFKVWRGNLQMFGLSLDFTLLFRFWFWRASVIILLVLFCTVGAISFKGLPFEGLSFSYALVFFHSCWMKVCSIRKKNSWCKWKNIQTHTKKKPNKRESQKHNLQEGTEIQCHNYKKA